MKFRTQQEMDADYDLVIVLFNWKRSMCWRIFASSLCANHQFGDGLRA